MARTNKKGYSPTGKLADVTPDMAAADRNSVADARRTMEDGHHLSSV
jgi:hypothetical protein